MLGRTPARGRAADLRGVPAKQLSSGTAKQLLHEQLGRLAGCMLRLLKSKFDRRI